jgi:two-component system response regulator AtoC
MRSLQPRVERIAMANLPVLIYGESGTGKDFLARFIHLRSPWARGSFVKISCPAIPGTLLESELFGYEKGSFTGAVATKPGRVELAHQGTLFLDQISELSLALLAKLLWLLQDGQFSRIGAQEDKRVEVRIVCSSNHNVEQLIEAGRFREDLFYLINVVSLHLPPLRRRRQDIPTLVNYLLDLHNRHYDGHARPVSQYLMRLLQSYEWPGNIRQLDNVIKRYVILGSEDEVCNELLSPGPDDLTAEILPDGPVSLKEVTRQAVRELERKIILRALRNNRWNRRMAARDLNISYRALLYKLRQTKLSPESTETF